MDLNKDGYVDILSGSYSRKTEDMAGEFHVLYGKKGGGYSKPVLVENSDGAPLEINQESRITDVICTRPYAVDLNADGNLDIVSGNFSGSFAIFWSDSSGKFSSKSTLLRGQDDEVLAVDGGHSDPSFVDWDGDGDLDMLSGSGNGGAYLFENIGDNTKPAFDKITQLVAPKPKEMTPMYGANLATVQGALRVAVPEDSNTVQSEEKSKSKDASTDRSKMASRAISLSPNDAGKQAGSTSSRAFNLTGADGKKPTSVAFSSVQLVAPAASGDVKLYGVDIERPQKSTRVIAADVNRDGKLDLLVGDSASIYQPRKGLSESECLSQLAAWEKAKAELEAGNAKNVDSKEYRVAQIKLVEELHQIVEKRGTGFVWLFLRE